MPLLNNRPMLLIHSTVDGTIPVSHAYKLQQLGASNPKFEAWITPASGHVQAYKDHPQEYMSRVLAFFAKYLE